jgi:uncharacterized protein YkwD
MSFEETEKEEHINKQEQGSTSDTPDTLNDELWIKDDMQQDEKEDNEHHLQQDVTIMLSSQDEIETMLPNHEFRQTAVAGAGDNDDEDSSLGGEKENVEAAVNMQKDIRVIGDTIETSNAKHGKGMDMVNVAATNLFMLMPTDAQEETYFIKMDTSAKSNAPEADADDNIASQEKQDNDVNVVEASQLSMQEKTPTPQVLLHPLLQSNSPNDNNDETKVSVLASEPDNSNTNNEVTTQVAAGDSTTLEQNVIGEPTCQAAQDQEANDNNVRAIDIATSNDDTRKTDDDDKRSWSPLPEQGQELVDHISLDIVNGSNDAANNSNGAVHAVVITEGSSCMSNELEKKGNEILLQPNRICSLLDKVEQRQEDVNSSHSALSSNDKDDEETSRDCVRIEKDSTTNKSKNNTNLGFVRKSDLLQGNAILGLSASNISSISVDTNENQLINQIHMALDTTTDDAPEIIIHGKTQKRPREHDNREGPALEGDDEESLDSMEEIILNVTSEYVDTYSLMNRERNAQGLDDLHRCKHLDSLAMSHVNLIAERGMLGHSVDSLSALQEKLNSNIVGENIQCGQNENEMHLLALQAGTSSRHNIMRPSYKQVGVGTAMGEDGMLYMVQLFRGPVLKSDAEIDMDEMDYASSIWCSYLWC